MSAGPENLDNLAKFLLVPREDATEADWTKARLARATDRRARQRRKRAKEIAEKKAAFMSGDKWV